MRIGGRPLSAIAGAPFHRRHYVAAVNMLRIYTRPMEMCRRYLLGLGAYPAAVEVRTPMGNVELIVYSAHDVLTVNEIFCRLDYHADSSDKVFVDFGSNIGISAAYFLTRGPRAFAYLFEPLPQNVERLRRNLSRFEGSYALREVAVAGGEGEVEFGWEETGRYGGIGVKTGRSVKVRCVDSNEVLSQVLEKHGRIDVLKVDVETLEREITERIPADIARRIKRIYVEYPFGGNPLETTHAYRQYSSVAQFQRLGESRS